MPILVWSADFDGSLSNQHFLQRPELGIIAANHDLLEKLKAMKKNYSKMITFVGSNRQSLRDDLSNAGSNKNGSFFPRIQEISDHLGAEFDPFLLADLYSEQQPGTAYQEAMSVLNGAMDYPAGRIESPYEWLHDENKLSILLAQMHKVAQENPGDIIDFLFTDDRDSILSVLQAYFSLYPELIPNNLKLQLIQHDGINQRVMNVIDGRGPIVKNYVALIRDVAAVGIEAVSKTDYALCSAQGSVIRNFDDAKAANFDVSKIDLAAYYTPSKTDDALCSEQGSVIYNFDDANTANFDASKIDLAAHYTPKKSFFDRHKHQIIGGSILSSTLIGAGVGLILLLTGVAAPFGVGIVGMALFVGLTALVGTWFSSIVATIGLSLSSCGKTGIPGLCVNTEKTNDEKNAAQSSYARMSEQGLPAQSSGGRYLLTDSDDNENQSPLLDFSKPDHGASAPEIHGNEDLLNTRLYGRP